MVWTGVITFFFYCWGLIETYSAYLDTTSLLKVTSSTAIYFYSAKWSLYTPIFIYMNLYYLYDHFMHKLFKFYRWQS